MDVQGWLILAAAIASPLVSFLVAARRMSGKISTTSADELWDEARDIRADYRAQVQTCRSELADARQETATARQENARLRNELADSRQEVAALKNQVTELMEGR